MQGNMAEFYPAHDMLHTYQSLACETAISTESP